MHTAIRKTRKSYLHRNILVEKVTYTQWLPCVRFTQHNVTKMKKKESPIPQL